MFRILIALVVVTFGFVGASSANIFDEIPMGTWVRVQDGAVVQWSVVPDMSRATRLDLVSYIDDDGVRKAYYLIRRSCSDDSKVESQVIMPGNVLGVGVDCNGDIPSTSVFSTLVDIVDELPTEAVALLP
jgi:hypothetical protein